MSVVILAIGLIIFLAHFFTALFEKTKIPDVLLLMIIGIIGGPILGIVTPDDFGRFGSVLTTIALIVILFEGGTTLNVKTLGQAIGPTLALSLLTFAATAALTTGLCLVILQFSTLSALMAGAIVAGTSSAVVVPMVRGLNLKEPGSTVLILESALTDVLCIVLTFAFIQAFTEGNLTTGEITITILKSLGIAMVLGFIGGLVWQVVLGWIRQFPNTLFTTLAFIFVLYGVSQLLGYSGAITALSFGITLTNFENFHLDKLPFLRAESFAKVTSREKSFYGEMVFLLKIFFFLYLGISFRFDNLGLSLFGVIIVGGIYVMRLGITRLITSRKTTWKDASMISIMVPKGLAAAVLAGLPLQAGVLEGATIQSMTYAIVLFSILLTAIMVPVIDRTGLRHVYRKLFGPFADDTLIEPDTASTQPVNSPHEPPTG